MAMNNDDLNCGDNVTITLSDAIGINDDYTVNINDYTVDTIDFSGLTISTTPTFTTSRDNKRVLVRDNGKIPVDIWAKMFNNGVMEIEDDDTLPF